MHKRTKSGDTLVEVALAIGIFSLVAIATTAVLTSSTSGAQSALETTLAREEIDTQAEAIRFIQTAYSTNRNNTENNAYAALWRKITSRAINLDTVGDTKTEEILNYTPSSCSALYNDDSLTKNHMFILNTKKLSTLTTATVDDVFISDSDKLKPASVNPRMIYVGATSASTSTSQDLLIDDNYTNLYRAEGIYIIAVKDTRTTNIVDITDGLASQESAYYDFYIRTCWYSTNSSQPSAISTVVRLYDPDVLQTGGTIKVDYHYSKTSSAWPADYGNADANLTKTFASQGPARKVTVRDVDKILGWDFKWKDITTGETFSSNTTITNPDSDTSKYYQLYPAWEHRKYTIKYNLNYPYASSSGVITPSDQTCYQDTGCQLITKDKSARPTASGYTLRGWCTVAVGVTATCPSDKFYALDYSFPTGTNFPTGLFSGSGRTLNLYAVWAEHGETITIKATWTTNTDYDTYIYGTTFRGNSFNCYFGRKSPTETVNGITHTLATLDHDGRGNINGYYNETFTIDTLGGRAYYYSIKNWSKNYYIYNGISITVSGPELGTKTYHSTDMTNCMYWNVFSYEDGKIVDRNTCSNTPERGY